MHRRTLLLLGLLSCVGCAAPAEPQGLDVELARQSFQRFLETWKRGGTIAELKSGSPSLIVGDPDWEAGMKLASFVMVEGKERNDGTNLHLTVRLTLGDKKAVSEVAYVIGTRPVVTIQRK